MDNQETITLPLEVILATLPITGNWTLQKTDNQDPAQRYSMAWSEKIKGQYHGITKYGNTARQAAARVLCEIKGDLTDREPDD